MVCCPPFNSRFRTGDFHPTSHAHVGRTMARSGGGDFVEVVDQLPPPAYRGRSSLPFHTRLSMKRSLTVPAIMVLVLFAVLLPRVDAVAQNENNKYSDDKYDFTIEVSQPWRNAPLQGYTVPGVARAAYAGSRGASIVVFVQEPGKAFDPRFLVDESAKSMEKSLAQRCQKRMSVT